MCVCWGEGLIAVRFLSVPGLCICCSRLSCFTLPILLVLVPNSLPLGSPPWTSLSGSDSLSGLLRFLGSLIPALPTLACHCLRWVCLPHWTVNPIRAGLGFRDDYCVPSTTQDRARHRIAQGMCVEWMNEWIDAKLRSLNFIQRALGNHSRILSQGESSKIWSVL